MSIDLSINPSDFSNPFDTTTGSFGSDVHGNGYLEKTEENREKPHTPESGSPGPHSPQGGPSPSDSPNSTRKITDETNGGEPPKAPIEGTFHKIIRQIIEIFEKKVWPGIKETSGIIKNGVKIAIVKSPELVKRIGKIVAYVGVLAAVNILLTIKSLPGSVESVIKNINCQDGEGAVLSTLDLLAAPADVLDQLGTFTGGLAQLGLIPFIGFFGLIGLPVALGLVVYANVSGIYSLSHQTASLAHLPKGFAANEVPKLREWLEEKIDVTDHEKGELEKRFNSTLDVQERKKLIDAEIKVIKDLKTNKLKRRTDQKVVKIMQEMLQKSNEGLLGADGANKQIHEMRSIMTRKITIGAVSQGVKLALLTTLIFTAVFPILPGISILIVLLLKSVLGLGKHIYEQCSAAAEAKAEQAKAAAAA